MAIRYDRTRISIVVVCDCGWADVGVSKTAAWSLAAEHEARAHPGSWQIRDAARKRGETISDDE